MSQFFNLDSSEHSKGYDHTASSIPVPLIYLDQMPMSTMLSETSSDKTYFDSSQSFDNTTDRATQKITSEKNTLPAMPVGDEISYNKPQQFTVSADPPTRPISTYLPRTPSRKTNTSSQFTSLTDSPFLTTHLPMNNNGFPNVGTKKNYSQTDYFTLPTDFAMATNSSFKHEKCLHQPLQISRYLQGRCHPRAPFKVKNSTEKTM